VDEAGLVEVAVHVAAPEGQLCRIGSLTSTTLSREGLQKKIESAAYGVDLGSIKVDVDNPPPAIGRTRILSWPGYTINWMRHSSTAWACYMYAGVDGSDAWSLQRPATRDADGARHFIKAVASDDAEEVEELVAEGELLRELASGSPCIMPVVDVARCVWHGTPAAAIIMPLAQRWPADYCEQRGVLGLEQAPMPAPLALQCLRRVAQALAHMHSLGVAHRDVKPWNVLYLEDEAYLADVGLSVRGPWTHPLGTHVYMAPEARRIVDAMVARKMRAEVAGGASVPTKAEAEAEALADAEYDGLAADMWSLGMTYVKWRSGAMPMIWDSEADFMWSVRYHLGQPVEVPHAELEDMRQARDPSDVDMLVVHSLLQMDPTRRVTAAALVSLLDTWTATG
jgi:serine/threonine protein kinase